MQLQAGDLKKKLWLAAVCLITGCAEGGDDHAAHWGYGSDDGPSFWAGLNADWAVCDSGAAQAPIDIRDAEDDSAEDAVAMDIPEASIRIIPQVLDVLNNGHTIQVNVDARDTLTLGEKSFDLLQLHFHAPSEHTVDGHQYAMEMHLVHERAGAELAVVGVFIEEGAYNAAFEPIWSNMPSVPGTETPIGHVQVKVADLLPSDIAGWSYNGSLTTPPCSEGVRWVVLKTPIGLDVAQIEQFEKIFTGNNRPTQPLHGRSVVTGLTRVQ